MITHREAESIAKKLKASIEKGRKHDKVQIEIDGVIVGRFNIRRGTHSDHSFIPKQIGVSLRQALDLAHCPMSHQQYIQHIRDNGLT